MSEIRVKEGESLESALRRFKRSTARSGVLAEVRKREAYEKPSVKRKKKSEAARKRKFKSDFLPMNDCADPRIARVCTFCLARCWRSAAKKGFVACGCATLLPLGGQNDGRQPAELAPLVRLQAPLGLASLTRPRTPPLDSPRRKKVHFRA